MQSLVAEELEKKSEQKEREMTVSDEEMAKRWVSRCMNPQTNNLSDESLSGLIHTHLFPGLNGQPVHTWIALPLIFQGNWAIYPTLV